ncbi:MAG TPA: oligosaccharide flippase family protein, partial [Gammaproteobacteria bacterium]
MTAAPHRWSRRSLAWNGIWTIALGASTALLALLLPPFLTRLLSPAEYGAWALALQIASYVLLLGFGLQVAVGRFVALEAHSPGASHPIVVAAFRASCVAAAAGLGLVAVVAALLPRFVSDLPSELHGDFRIALLLCGASAASSLVGTVFTGTFLGEQRAHVPALIALGGRALQCALVVATVRRVPSVPAVAAAFAAGQALLLAAQVLGWWKWSGVRGVVRGSAGRSHYRELGAFCAPFVLWNLLAALSSGTDLVIVSKLDFERTPYYAVSLTIVSLFAGLLSAGYNAMLPAAARHVGAGDRAGLEALLFRVGPLGIGLSLALGLPLMVASTAPVSLWVGEAYAVAAAPYLSVLVLAQIVRLSMSMYGIATIAAGRHGTMLLGPVLDAAVALTAAIALGREMGALGVAIGMVAGAATNLLTWCWRDPLREVFGARQVAWSFLRAAALPAACGAVGVAAMRLGAGAVDWLQGEWVRFGASVAVAGVVAGVALALAARGGRSRLESRSHP